MGKQKHKSAFLKNLFIINLILIICCILVYIFVYTSEAKVGIPSTDTLNVVNQTEFSIQPTTLELYNIVIVTLLTSHIDNAIKEYYGTEHPFEISSTKIITLEHKRSTGYQYLITLEIYPFKLAHRTIGIDRITFHITPYEVNMIKFDHIKSLDTDNPNGEKISDLSI